MTKPQNGFVFLTMSGVKDGEALRVVGMETEVKNNHCMLFFFMTDKVLSFSMGMGVARECRAVCRSLQEIIRRLFSFWKESWCSSYPDPTDFVNKFRRGNKE